MKYKPTLNSIGLKPSQYFHCHPRRVDILFDLNLSSKSDQISVDNLMTI